MQSKDKYTNTHVETEEETGRGKDRQTTSEIESEGQAQLARKPSTMHSESPWSNKTNREKVLTAAISIDTAHVLTIHH